jgi:hypothetical protein
MILIPANGGGLAVGTDGHLRIFWSKHERIVSIFMKTSVGVHTRRALWSTWRTVAPVGAWFNSVGKTDAEDYGAVAPWRAEELPFTILIPELRVGSSGGIKLGKHGPCGTAALSANLTSQPR